VPPGSNVTFSVSVANGPAWNYQWKFNGQALAGATNAAYSIATVGSNDVGSYTVVVGQGLRQVESPPALLEVSWDPAVQTEYKVEEPFGGVSAPAGRAKQWSSPLWVAPGYNSAVVTSTGASGNSYSGAGGTLCGVIVRKVVYLKQPYVCASAGKYALNTTNSTGDTVLGVIQKYFTAPVSPCNDDGLPNQKSKVCFDAAANVKVQVVLGEKLSTPTVLAFSLAVTNACP
jgi:hypothetical protein